MIFKYELRNTFNGYNKILIDNRFYIVFPELLSEIKKYENVLEKSSLNIEKPFKDYFEIPINTGFDKDNYTLIWNIDEVLRFVANMNFNETIIPIGHESVWSCPSLLCKEKMVKMSLLAKIDKPIILAYHYPIRKYLVIDGNHRYHVAKNRNETSINAVILKPSDHIRFLINETCRNLYKIHHNLSLLKNLNHFPVWNTYKLSDNLEQFSFYPLTDAQYKFNLFRNIKFRIIQKSLSYRA